MIRSFERWTPAPAPAGPPSDEPLLVVDFGTSWTSAVLVEGGHPRMVQEPASNSWSWPSAVCVDGESVLVGSPADNLRRVDPPAYRSEFKRDLGDPAPIQLGGKSFRPEDLVTELLVAVRAQADLLAVRPIERLLLTVPASYGPADPRRQLMIMAGERAGFAEVELLPEPVAAAFAPVRGEPFRAGDTVLVYDFGGGTFDAALVRISGDGAHKVLGHLALDDCGGRDVDAAILQQIRATSGPGLEDLMAGDTAADVRMELVDLAQRVKHQLTDTHRARDRYAPARLAVDIDRGVFGTLAYPILERTIACCHELLRRADMPLTKVTAVLLVGGSSRMPIVTEAIQARLGRPVRYSEDPSTAVVTGAARWAGSGARPTAALSAAPADEKPLSWVLPGGSGTVVRWLVEPGQRYEAGAPMVSVRLGEGDLVWLSDDRAGTLLRARADAGETVVSGDWLAMVRPAPTPATDDPAPAARRRSPVPARSSHVLNGAFGLVAALAVAGAAGLGPGGIASIVVLLAMALAGAWFGYRFSGRWPGVRPWVPTAAGTAIWVVLALVVMSPILLAIEDRGVGATLTVLIGLVLPVGLTAFIGSKAWRP